MVDPWTALQMRQAASSGNGRNVHMKEQQPLGEQKNIILLHLWVNMQDRHHTQDNFVQMVQ